MSMYRIEVIGGPVNGGSIFFNDWAPTMWDEHLLTNSTLCSGNPMTLSMVRNVFAAVLTHHQRFVTRGYRYRIVEVDDAENSQPVG